MSRSRPRPPEPPPLLVEMSQMWDGVAVRTVVLERARRALTLGESHACDFYAPADRFDAGVEAFPVVERAGTEILVRLATGITARIERGGRELSDAQLVATGMLRREETTGDRTLKLMPGARVRLDVGGLEFVVQRVREGRFDLRAVLTSFDPRLAGALSLALFCGYGAIAVAIVYAAAAATPDLSLAFLRGAPPEEYTHGPVIEARMVLAPEPATAPSPLAASTRAPAPAGSPSR